MSTSTLVAAPTAQHPFIAPEREPHLPHLVRSRDDLLLNGWSERAIGAAVRAGELFHIRRGWYMTADDRASLSPAQRHRAHVIAVARDAHEGTASHTSAGVLWGLPFYRVRFARVHLTTASPHRISSGADVMRHVGGLPPEDVAVIDGIRCTSLARTVFDLIRILPLEAAVGVADAAERMMGLRLREWDLDAIASWRGGMQERVDAGVGARGIRQARWVADFADGRAQLPGESVSRLQLHRLGFAPPDLQVPVAGPHGADYLVDFGLDDVDRVHGMLSSARHPRANNPCTRGEVVHSAAGRGQGVRPAPIWGSGADAVALCSTEDRRSSSCANTKIEALLSRGPRR